MKGKKFTVVGGDMRLVHLLCQLRGKVYCAEASALFMEKAAEHLPAEPWKAIGEALPKSAVVIFGVPMLESGGQGQRALGYENPGVKALFTHIFAGTVVFWAAVFPRPSSRSQSKKIEVLDT